MHVVRADHPVEPARDDQGNVQPRQVVVLAQAGGGRVRAPVSRVRGVEPAGGGPGERLLRHVVDVGIVPDGHGVADEGRRIFHADGVDPHELLPGLVRLVDAHPVESRGLDALEDEAQVLLPRHLRLHLVEDLLDGYQHGAAVLFGLRQGDVGGRQPGEGFHLHQVVRTGRHLPGLAPEGARAHDFLVVNEGYREYGRRETESFERILADVGIRPGVDAQVSLALAVDLAREGVVVEPVAQHRRVFVESLAADVGPALQHLRRVVHGVDHAVGKSVDRPYADEDPVEQFVAGRRMFDEAFHDPAELDFPPDDLVGDGGVVPHPLEHLQVVLVEGVFLEGFHAQDADVAVLEPELDRRLAADPVVDPVVVGVRRDFGYADLPQIGIAPEASNDAGPRHRSAHGQGAFPQLGADDQVAARFVPQGEIAPVGVDQRPAALQDLVEHGSTVPYRVNRLHQAPVYGIGPQVFQDERDGIGQDAGDGLVGLVEARLRGRSVSALLVFHLDESQNRVLGVLQGNGEEGAQFLAGQVFTDFRRIVGTLGDLRPAQAHDVSLVRDVAGHAALRGAVDPQADGRRVVVAGQVRVLSRQFQFVGRVVGHQEDAAVLGVEQVVDAPGHRAQGGVTVPVKHAAQHFVAGLGQREQLVNRYTGYVHTPLCRPRIAGSSRFRPDP